MAFISHLRLRHFRNYTSFDQPLCPGLTLLTGSNGQGKTSLLEAIHYLSLLRSFRTRKVSDLVHWQSDYFYTEADVSDGIQARPAIRLSAAYRGRRRLRRNGALITRASEFINSFLCVPFVPEDIDIVKGSPGSRRRFLDIVLSQTSTPYLCHLMDYTAALKSRNVILKETGRYGKSALKAYDCLLAQHGAFLIAARQQFCAAFGALYQQVCERLFDPEAPFTLGYVMSGVRQQEYERNQDSLQEKLLQLLEAEQKRDIDNGNTRFGPHRDEIMLQISGKPLAAYGSEGQCRVAALAMRLAGAEHLLTVQDNRGLILLVDDVLGELDSRRRRHFLGELLRAEQVFLACTEVPPELDKTEKRVFAAKDGHLEEA
jgi:DNA replication and repair protein RecF